jgi:hypothetical protein
MASLLLPEPPSDAVKFNGHLYKVFYERLRNRP